MGALVIVLAVLLGTGTARVPLTSAPHDVAVSTQQSQSSSQRTASALPRPVAHTHPRFTAAAVTSTVDGLLPVGVFLFGLAALGVLLRRARSPLAALRALLQPGRGPPARPVLAGCSPR
jgi:hypothetical protein